MKKSEGHGFYYDNIATIKTDEGIWRYWYSGGTIVAVKRIQ